MCYYKVTVLQWIAWYPKRALLQPWRHPQVLNVCSCLHGSSVIVIKLIQQLKAHLTLLQHVSHTYSIREPQEIYNFIFKIWEEKIKWKEPEPYQHIPCIIGCCATLLYSSLLNSVDTLEWIGLAKAYLHHTYCSILCFSLEGLQFLDAVYFSSWMNQYNQ